MMNVQNVVSDKKCCGCSMCKHICPHNAITMIPDNHGFMHPQADQLLCTECGFCVRVCPEVEENFEKQNYLHCYGVINNDNDIKRASTSGGLFSLLADYTLANSGAVYGAVYNDGIIEHIRVSGSYEAMRGSKYCQSNIDDVIELLVDDLKKGTKVLFTGTPCQCAGIKKLLSIRKLSLEGLLLVDIVCHGVVSPMLLKDYIKYAEKRSGKKIVVHKFRDKVNGWSQYTESNLFIDGTYDYQSYESQLYKRVFLSHYGLRESCFNCLFTSHERVSDITMADFWGLNKTRPEMWNNEGISFAIVSTDKGENAIQAIKDRSYIFAAAMEDTKQPQLLAPSQRPFDYDAFWSCYVNGGFKKIVIQYFHGGKLRRWVSDLVKKIK